VHPIAVCGVIPVWFFGCVAMEENRYRDLKGVISDFLQALKGAHQTIAD
jgi:hypothetical protein